MAQTVTEQGDKPVRKKPVTSTETTRAFNNPVIEFLSRTHIAVPLVLYYGMAVVMVTYGVYNGIISPWEVTATFIGGFLSFTLIEYILHRKVFHMRIHTKIRERVQYALHGLHHEQPRDKKRLAMPPLSSMTLATILYFTFYVIMGDLTYGFLSGFVCGYAFYLSMHYIVHIVPQPKNFFKLWWINHNYHHFRDHTVAFGVSSPLWDWVFGTLPDVKEFKTKKK